MPETYIYGGKPAKTENADLILAHPEGFEPPTKWFEATYSIQLSYGCVTPSWHRDKTLPRRINHPQWGLGADHTRILANRPYRPRRRIKQQRIRG